MSRIRWGVVVCCLMMLVFPMPSLAASGDYHTNRLTKETSYVRSRGAERVFAAEIGRPVHLKVVLAHDKVDGQRETVQSMCRRYHCLVGINGDFFGGPTRHGPIVIENHVLRTATTDSSQLWLAKLPTIQSAWASPDIELRSDAKVYHLPLNPATNLGIGAIYTSAFGGAIVAPEHGEIQIYRCECHTRPDITGARYQLHRIGAVQDKRKISLGPDQVAIRLMPSQIKDIGSGLKSVIYMVVPKSPVQADEAIGAHPVLVSRGRVSSDLTNEFATSLHPRSVFAYNAAGMAWIIAIDTRVTLVRAAQIALKLGASEAINLDGGGSTTFVVHGRTVNNPADKAERAVASALIVIESAPKISHHKLKPKSKPAIPRAKPHPRAISARRVVIRLPMQSAPRPIVLLSSHESPVSVKGPGLLAGCIVLLSGSAVFSTRRRK